VEQKNLEVEDKEQGGIKTPSCEGDIGVLTEVYKGIAGSNPAPRNHNQKIK